MKKITIPFASALVGFCTLSPLAVHASPAPDRLFPTRLYQALQQVNAVRLLDKASLVEIILSLLILLGLLGAWVGMQGPSTLPPVTEKTHEPVANLTVVPIL